MKAELNRIAALPCIERYKAFISYANNTLVPYYFALIDLECEDAGINDTKTLAKRINTDPTGYRRSMQGSHLKMISVANITNVAYDFLRISCHKFYFGNKSLTILPSEMASMAYMLMFLSVEPFNSFEQKINAISTRTQANEIFGLNQDPYLTMCLRMRKMAKDKGWKIQELCNDSILTRSGFADPNIKQNLRKISRWYDNGMPSDKIPQLALNTVAYTAFELGQSLDYFVAHDYIRFTEIGFYVRDLDSPNQASRKLVYVTNYRIRELLRKYLYFTEENKNLFKRELVKAVGSLNHANVRLN